MAERNRETDPIGLVVEGRSEYHALPKFLARLNVECAAPAVFHGQHVELDAVALARKVAPFVRTQARKQIGKVVIVLDRENRPECAPEFAASAYEALINGLRAVGEADKVKLSVVVADRKFENWLLADPEGLAGHSFIQNTVRRKGNRNVDGSDGEEELRQLFVKGRNYEKGLMSGQLAERIRVERTAVQRRSRSLRKFVREVRG